MAAKKPPRVAIIASNYWPERTGIGQVTTEFAEYLAAAGINVRVATAMPYYPEWSIHSAYQGKVWSTEVRNGVWISRATHHASPSPGAVSRIFHEGSLCVLSLPNMIRALRGSSTAIIVSPDLSHAFLGCVVARVMGVKPILYVQDIMPDAAIELGMLTNRFVIGVSQALARATYAMSRSILTLSEGMRSRIARVVGADKSIEVVPNTIDADELAPKPNQGEPFRDAFVDKNSFAVLHTGNMGEKQDLNVIIRTAVRLASVSSIHFFVFGDGAAKAEFVNAIEHQHLSNVSVFPLQPRPMLAHMLFGADVCLVTQSSAVIDIVVPSKLITCMGAGALVVAVCSPDSETARIVDASGGALRVPAGDDAALASLLMSLQAEGGAPDLRKKARSYAVRYFDRNRVYAPIASSIHRAALETTPSE